jgi:hypothetical protein
MLYLMLFSVMAVGFYAATTLASQISANDKRAVDSQIATESGLDFIRYELGQVTITGVTDDSQVLTQTYNQLKARMNGTGNLGLTTYAVGYDGTQITIPDDTTAFIPIETGGPRFRTVITRDKRELIVKVVGNGGAGYPDRAVQVRFHINERPSTIFGYGVATKGPLSLSGGFVKGVPDASRGSILSTVTTTTTPITMSGSAAISGNVDLVNAAGTVSGGTVGGTIKTGVTAPEFPSVDPTAFVDYLVGKETIISASTSATPLSNIRIKAGTNPTFSGGPTIKGVILIEAPNKVTFSGGANIQGVIVVDKPTEGTSTNTIIFSGGGTLTGPETLDATYGALTTMTGSAILAPNFALSLTGGSASFGGAVIVKSVGLSGGSGGSTTGSVISTGTATTTWSGGSGFTLTGTASTAKPIGVRFSGNYNPVPSSYDEVAP